MKTVGAVIRKRNAVSASEITPAVRNLPHGTKILTIHNKLNGLETKVLMARVPQNSHGCFH